MVKAARGAVGDTLEPKSRCQCLEPSGSKWAEVQVKFTQIQLLGYHHKTHTISHATRSNHHAEYMYRKPVLPPMLRSYHRACAFRLVQHSSAFLIAHHNQTCHFVIGAFLHHNRSKCCAVRRQRLSWPDSLPRFMTFGCHVLCWSQSGTVHASVPKQVF
jgi:hypothetical protein